MPPASGWAITHGQCPHPSPPSPKERFVIRALRNVLVGRESSAWCSQVIQPRTGARSAEDVQPLEWSDWLGALLCFSNKNSRFWTKCSGAESLDRCSNYPVMVSFNSGNESYFWVIPCKTFGQGRNLLAPALLEGYVTFVRGARTHCRLK